MTDQLDDAADIARALFGGDPVAEQLLRRRMDANATADERARAHKALTLMFPAVMREIPDEHIRPRRKLRALWEGAKAALDELDRWTVGDFSDRTTTGLLTLDRRLRGGLRGGQMYLLGAPTGAGKTALCQQIATAAARQKERGAVVFVSPEMSLESLSEREIIHRAQRSLWERAPWTAGPFRETAIRDHAVAASEMIGEKLPVFVLEDLSVTMDSVEAAVRDTQEQHGKLALVVIDYAQEVATQDGRVQRYLQVGEVGGRSVDISLRYNVPVLVASQVNVVKEGNKRSYTFRESGNLAQKANTTMILDVTWNVDAAGERSVERADIVCEKQRGFAPFRLRVEYNPALYTISEYREWSTPTQVPLLPPAVPA
jgi:replicative DNA helicase